MTALTPMTSPVFVNQPALGGIRYGLYAASLGPFDLPQHGAVGGVQYLEEHCGQAHLLAAASCSNPTVGINLDACDGTAVGLPFEVVATLKAGAFPYDAAEVERRARVRIADNEQYVAEQAMWGGTADVQSVLLRPELNGGAGIADVAPTPGTAVTLEYGIGLLENAMAQYSYPGVFHAQPVLTPFLVERQLMPLPQQSDRGVTGVQYTPMGNRWSFGRGYTGHKPTDDTVVPAAGTAYIVATGSVAVWRDPTIYVNPPTKSFDRSGNAWQAVAQRAMAITVDCVAFFVLVSLNSMTAATSITPATTINY